MQVLFYCTFIVYPYSWNKISFDKILRNETTSYGLDRFYINLLLKSCQFTKAKLALGCWYYKELLKMLKVAQTLPNTIYLCLGAARRIVITFTLDV